MRISWAIILAVLVVLMPGERAQAQLHPCDDCDILFDGDEILFAYCVLGGGGPFTGCYQQNPNFCSFEGFCAPEQQLAFVVGKVTTVVLRGCDGTTTIRAFVADDPVAGDETPHSAVGAILTPGSTELPTIR